MKNFEGLKYELQLPLNSRAIVCPARTEFTSFQLVDESGKGEAYGGLQFEVIDSEGVVSSGVLNELGVGEVSHYSGGMVLLFSANYFGAVELYKDLVVRDDYPLKITELQVRAENTFFANADGTRTRSNEAMAEGEEFYQVEVRDLVEHTSHLPPSVARHFPPDEHARKLMRGHGQHGVCLKPNRKTVLEVRPLRALRPILAKSHEFSLLNMYQLSLLATLSYAPFGQRPDEHPITSGSVTFPETPSSGDWFANKLNRFEETRELDAALPGAYLPLLEEVAYSARWEVVPFDPDLYPENDPALGDEQESPVRVHFLDDRGQRRATDTQAYATHSDEHLLIAIRGTNEIPADLIRDIDFAQVEFTEGKGRAHKGFYEAAVTAFRFAERYMSRFHTNQQVIICGHSLGGAIALLLSEMIRRKRPGIDLQLYTFGAPRAGDATFVQSAASLTHHRIVYNNDPAPSVPATWMHKPLELTRQSLEQLKVDAILGTRKSLTSLILEPGQPYEHHGQMRHFMVLPLVEGRTSAVLWTPGCQSITEGEVCDRMLRAKDGLPERRAFVDTLFLSADHRMIRYIPGCWAALRRYQEALRERTAPVTRRELELLTGLIRPLEKQLGYRHAALSDADPYRRVQQINLQMLEEEIGRLKASLRRLQDLAHTQVDATMLYGELAGTQRLAEALERWHAHPENNRAEQLAMAPPELAPALPDMKVVTFEQIMASLDDPFGLI
ncbi:lipase family protein [Pseudomonas xanthosomatis]|uniref:lipase family protein n=1 Tax=Pseudomonas xanthosomatis TaxID=2842356 RepID=UPI0035195121